MISTDKIILKPLTFAQVVKFINLNNELEEELGLNNNYRTITDRLKGALEKYTLKWIMEDPDNYLFATIWVIIDKAENIITGEIGFKRKPNEAGEIEIGYSVQPPYYGKGYMSAAVKEMVNWAFAYPDVKTILAETRDDNKASIRVLAKSGFTEHKRVENMIWWKLENSVRQAETKLKAK